MNILFVLYHDFTSNSASHVAALANELIMLGHDCAIAVPENKGSLSHVERAYFKAVEYSIVLSGAPVFENERGPDLVHAWTPREVVRRFCEQLQERCESHLFIHMEDNEWHLLACAFGEQFDALAAAETEELDRRVPPHLSHPHRARAFLSSATGVTVIIDRLQEILPPVKAIFELWPSADEALFKPKRKDLERRKALGVPVNATTIVYTGNVHSANAHEVRSLYLAVAMLNREGWPATLIRAGRDFYPFLGEDDRWGRQYSIELGMVSHAEVPELLAMADLLVQPGRADEFNDFRFPSKLPEFLSAGRPVILPNTNIGKHMAHRHHGYLLQEANAVCLFDAIKEVMTDADLYERLSSGALEFFRTRLSWKKTAFELARFYDRCIFNSNASSTVKSCESHNASRAVCHTGS